VRVCWNPSLRIWTGIQLNWLRVPHGHQITLPNDSASTSMAISCQFKPKSHQTMLILNFALCLLPHLALLFPCLSLVRHIIGVNVFI
jgi:hypothetical protein